MIKLQKQNQNKNKPYCMYNVPNHDPSSPYQSSLLSQNFYDHVSLIIKLFRKQLTLFIKLSQSFIEQTQLVDEIGKKKQEGMQAVKQYEAVVVDQQLCGIVQRFIARIREILQLTNNIAPGFLQYITNGVKKVEMFVHKNIGTITIFQIFNDILNILPAYFQSKALSPQKAKQKAKQNKQNIPQKRSTALDLILEGFKKSCSLLSTLDIDQAQYRALFFTARQDKHRETSYLENEMKYRNRFIKEEMQKYDVGYESYREKMKREKENYNKKQMSRMKRMVSLNEKVSPKKVQNEENADHNVSFNLKEIKEEKSYSPDFLLMQSKVQKSNLLATYNFNEGVIKHTTTHANMYSNKDRALYKQKINKVNQRSTNEKAREQEFQDFINEIKVKGQFRMTKVLFGRDGKLELSPYTDVKQTGNLNENATTAAIKNKIIFRKAQENIRKKLNRFTTQPAPLNPTIANMKPAIAQGSLLGVQKKFQVSIQPGECVKTGMGKKMRKFTWKDKEIKFMGVKGTSGVNSNQ